MPYIGSTRHTERIPARAWGALLRNPLFFEPEPEPEPEPDSCATNPRFVPTGGHGFEHERLDVYRASIELVAGADQLADRFPRGGAYLSDQLRRAVASIPLNIAEGAGEFAPADKARFYRMARRSATGDRSRP